MEPGTLLQIICLLHFFNLFIYLWLCWVFVSEQGLSLAAACGLVSEHRLKARELQWLQHAGSATGARRLQGRGSVVVAQGLRGPTACRTMLQHPGAGIEPVSPALAGGSLNHQTTREVPLFSIQDSRWL